MKILAINKIYPSRKNVFEAANVVAFELLAEMAKQKNIKVGFLKITIDDDLSDQKFGEYCEECESQGIELLKPLKIAGISQTYNRNVLGKAKRGFFNLRSLLLPKKEDFYPVIIHKREVERVIKSWGADVVLVIWSEIITALLSDCNVKVKYAYYGDPDHKSVRTRLQFNFRFLQNRSLIEYLKYVLRYIRTLQLERIHIKILKNYDIVGEVALNDVLYYRNRGLGKVFYVRNLWYEMLDESVFSLKEKREVSEHRILGNVGRLDGTANTLGLEILGKDIIPLLGKKLGMNSFEVHICGAGKPVPFVKNLLQQHKEAYIRGFVDDIDIEMLKAKVFLNVNNASSYKVGHTRYLYAWSLNTCIVAHYDASLSMPEIVHGYNALLGKDIEEIVDLLVEALHNKELRREIAKNGYETFKKLYVAHSIVPHIIKDIERVYARKTVHK